MLVSGNGVGEVIKRKNNIEMMGAGVLLSQHIDCKHLWKTVASNIPPSVAMTTPEHGLELLVDLPNERAVEHLLTLLLLVLVLLL